MVDELRKSRGVQVTHQGGIGNQVNEPYASHQGQAGKSGGGHVVFAQSQAQDSGVHLATVCVERQALENLEVTREVFEELAAGIIIAEVFGDHDVVHERLNLPGDGTVGQLTFSAHEGCHIFHANVAVCVQLLQVGEHLHVCFSEVGRVVGNCREAYIVPDTLGGFEGKSGAFCGFYGGVAAPLSQERLFEGSDSRLGFLVAVDIVLGEVLQNFEVQHLGFGAHGGAGTLRRVRRFMVVCRAHCRCRSFHICRIICSVVRMHWCVPCVDCALLHCIAPC